MGIGVNKIVLVVNYWNENGKMFEKLGGVSNSGVISS